MTEETNHHSEHTKQGHISVSKTCKIVKFHCDACCSDDILIDYRPPAINTAEWI